jgi:hypothetical protein
MDHLVLLDLVLFDGEKLVFVNTDTGYQASEFQWNLLPP